MQKYFKALLWINIAFSLIVLVLSASVLFEAGNQPATVAFLLVAIICVTVAVCGFLKKQPLVLGTSVFAISILLPTKFGMIPMIIAFILYMLLVSLYLYLLLFAEESM